MYTRAGAPWTGLPRPLSHHTGVTLPLTTGSSVDLGACGAGLTTFLHSPHVLLSWLFVIWILDSGKDQDSKAVIVDLQTWRERSLCRRRGHQVPPGLVTVMASSWAALSLSQQRPSEDTCLTILSPAWAHHLSHALLLPFLVLLLFLLSGGLYKSSSYSGLHSFFS